MAGVSAASRIRFRISRYTVSRTIGWSKALAWPPLNRSTFTGSRNIAAPIQAAGNQSVCSRTIRNTSKADNGASTTASHGPNVTGSTR